MNPTDIPVWDIVSLILVALVVIGGIAFCVSYICSLQRGGAPILERRRGSEQMPPSTSERRTGALLFLITIVCGITGAVLLWIT